jgi:hypothetical protein
VYFFAYVEEFVKSIFFNVLLVFFCLISSFA